jgi:hypothetical protein
MNAKDIYDFLLSTTALQEAVFSQFIVSLAQDKPSLLLRRAGDLLK